MRGVAALGCRAGCAVQLLAVSDAATPRCATDPPPRTRRPAPARSCLLARCYSGAGAALDADVYTVDPSKTATTPTDVLLYCYYGALLEIGR